MGVQCLWQDWVEVRWRYPGQWEMVPVDTDHLAPRGAIFVVIVQMLMEAIPAIEIGDIRLQIGKRELATYRWEVRTVGYGERGHRQFLYFDLPADLPDGGYVSRLVARRETGETIVGSAVWVEVKRRYAPGFWLRKRQRFWSWVKSWQRGSKR